MVNIYTQVIDRYHPTNKVEFVEGFLKECKNRNLVPRFHEFLNTDADGNYIYTKGYEKLLIDFKLFDESGNILPQKVVKPQFDNAYINKLIKDEIKNVKNREVASDEVYNVLEKKYASDGMMSTRDVYGSDGKEYDNVVSLNGKSIEKIIKDQTKFRKFVESLAGKYFYVFDANGNIEKIELAKLKETVSKDGKHSHPVIGKLVHTVGDIRRSAIVNIYDVVKYSNDSNEYTEEHNHKWMDENGWYKRYCFVEYNNVIYKVDLSIAKARDGRNILYSVHSDIKNGVPIDLNATNNMAVKIDTPNVINTTTDKFGQQKNSDGVSIGNLSFRDGDDEIKHGVYIDDSTSDYSDKIISGSKRYETRFLKLSKSGKYMNAIQRFADSGERVALVRSGISGRTSAYATAIFGQPIVVDNMEDWNRYREYTQVPIDDKYDMHDGDQKLLYPITNIHVLDEEVNPLRNTPAGAMFSERDDSVTDSDLVGAAVESNYDGQFDKATNQALNLYARTMDETTNSYIFFECAFDLIKLK